MNCLAASAIDLGGDTDNDALLPPGSPLRGNTSADWHDSVVVGHAVTLGNRHVTRFSARLYTLQQARRVMGPGQTPPTCKQAWLNAILLRPVRNWDDNSQCKIASHFPYPSIPVI